MLPSMQPGEIDRAIAAAAERKRACEAAARAMSFTSYAAYHLQRWHHEGWRMSDMAEECRVRQSAIREGGRELLGLTTVPSWEAGGSGHACGSDQIDGGTAGSY
jgi:hypothetical protein